MERDDYGTDMKIWIPINSDRTREFLEKIEGENIEEKISKWVEDSIKRWFADFTRHVCLSSEYRGITASSEVERVGVAVKIRDEQVFLRLDEGCDVSLYLDKVGYACVPAKLKTIIKNYKKLTKEKTLRNLIEYKYVIEEGNAEMGQKIEIEHDLPCSVNVEFSDVLSRDLSKFRAYISGEIEKFVSAVLILEALRKDCFIIEYFLSILSKYDEEFYRTVLTLAQNKWKFDFDIEERIIIGSLNTGLFRLSDVWRNYIAVIVSRYFDPECLEKHKLELEELNVLAIPLELPVPFAKALGCSVESIQSKGKIISVISKNNLDKNTLNLINKIIRRCVPSVYFDFNIKKIKLEKYYNKIIKNYFLVDRIYFHRK